MIKNYIVYNNLGQILKTGQCVEFDYDNQAQGDELIMEGEANSATQYIVKKKVVDLPEKPNGFYKFNYESKLWELDQFITISSNKSKRNDLLLSSDWTQLPDIDLSQAEKDRWKVYRQKLRDMTEADFISGDFPIL